MSTFSTHDLRSHAKPVLREKTHNTKWARGANEAAGQCSQHEVLNLTCAECLTRPKRRDQDRRVGRAQAAARHNVQNKLSEQAASRGRRSFRNDVNVELDDPQKLSYDNSSEEDEVADASAAPLPAGADFMYSYDAQEGPSAGRDVLSQAINQAVQRFESSETDKLVRKEYDMVEGKEDVDSYAADVDSADYELIDHTHLN